MECSICLDIYRDPRVLECGHTYCYECAVSMIDRHNLECPVCRRQFQVNNPHELKKNFQLAELIEEIQLKKNLNASGISSARQLDDTGVNRQVHDLSERKPEGERQINNVNEEVEVRNLPQEVIAENLQIPDNLIIERQVIEYNIRNTRVFYSVTKPTKHSLTIAAFFVLFFFPFDIAGAFYVGKTGNDCMGIKKWLLVWVIFSFFFAFLCIGSTGFFREHWRDLSILERILKVMIVADGFFLFVWLWVGISRTFVDSECRNNSYGVWAVSMGILILWVVVFGLILLFIMLIVMRKVGILGCILNVRKPKFGWSFGLFGIFLMLFFPFDVVGIFYLNNTGEDCKMIRGWLIAWTVFCFILLVLTFFSTGFIYRSWRRLTSMERFLKITLISVVLFMLSWLFVGSSIAFHSTECKSRSNKLWTISMAIIIFWICIIFLTLMTIFCGILSSCGFFNSYRFRVNGAFFVTFSLFHLIFFEIQSIIGIVFLNDKNACKYNESADGLRSWLTSWVVISFFSFVWYNLAGCSKGKSGFTKFVWAVVILISIGQVTMIFVGSALSFKDFGLSDGENCYNIWALNISICSIWIFFMFCSMFFVFYFCVKSSGRY